MKLNKLTRASETKEKINDLVSASVEKIVKEKSIELDAKPLYEKNEIDSIIKSIQDVINSDREDNTKALQEIEKDLNSLSISPEDIRDALESLKDDARLDASAIKGLEKFMGQAEHFFSGGGGEINTASNIGAGEGEVFKQKTDADLELRTIKAGTNITVTNNTSDIEIAVTSTTDADAIHDNVASEISAITEKATPIDADLLLIEDSADSNNKKKIQVGSLPEPLQPSLVYDSTKYYGSHLYVDTITTTSFTANIMYSLPMYAYEDITLEQLLLYLATGGGVGTSARMGIYDNNGSVNKLDVPNTLLIDTGEFAIDTTGVITQTVDGITGLSISKGTWFWPTLLVEDTITARCHGIGENNPFYGYVTDNSTRSQNRVQTNQAYGALPSTYGSVVKSNNAAPFIMFKTLA